MCTYIASHDVLSCVRCSCIRNGGQLSLIPASLSERTCPIEYFLFLIDMVREAEIAPAGSCSFALAGGLVFSVLCKGRVHVLVPGIPHPILAGSNSEFARIARGSALEGSWSFALAAGLVFSVLCKGRVVVTVPEGGEEMEEEGALPRKPMEEEANQEMVSHTDWTITASHYRHLRIFTCTRPRCSGCRLLEQKIHLQLYCFDRFSKYQAVKLPRSS